MDIEIIAAIESVKVKTKSVDGHLIRTCEMKFSREFDDVIAAGLRGEARRALEALRNHGMEQVVLPLDAVNVQGVMVAADDRVVVPKMVGVKAICTCGDADSNAPPSIDLVFTALWSESVWLFLGRYAGAAIELKMSDRQLGLPLPVPVEAGPSKARRAEPEQTTIDDLTRAQRASAPTVIASKDDLAKSHGVLCLSPHPTDKARTCLRIGGHRQRHRDGSGEWRMVQA